MMYSFDLKRKQPASHVSAIVKNSRLNLLGVCDIDENLRKIFEKEYGIKAFKNHKELFSTCQKNNKNIDLVVIATPESTHFKILQDCIEEMKKNSRKNIIFCEKPLVENLKECEKIKKNIGKNKINLIVNLSRRWRKIWQEAHKFSKKIGKIEKAAFNFSTSPENKNISQIRDGIHIADILGWFDIKNKIIINRLNTKYFLYDFHLWGTNGKIEILNVGQILKIYTITRSKKFMGFKELKLSNMRKIDESYLTNTYSEFVKFLDNKGKLSTNLEDAINAIDTFEKFVYDKNLSK